MLRALRDYAGEPHRAAFVRTVCDVDYINDSKGTNVGATVAALEGMGQQVVLIAGGQGKGQDFSPLIPVVSRHARAVVLIGQDGPEIGRVLAETGVELVSATSMREAVRHAAGLAKPGDAVLLSPACASLDMFATIRIAARSSWKRSTSSPVTTERSHEPVRRTHRQRQRRTAGRTRMRNFDLPLVIAASTLLLLGLLMVYSASIALADGPRYASCGRYYFVIRHGAFISAGLLAAAVTLTIPIRVWQRLAVPLFVLAMILLVAVLIPGIGREVNGAHRWIPLGPLNFQPSELMKLAALLYAADYTVRKQAHAGLRPRLPAHGLRAGWRGHAAAARARPGRIHGDRGHRHRHPVPGWHQRQVFQQPAGRAGQHLPDADLAVALAPRAPVRLSGPLERR